MLKKSVLLIIAVSIIELTIFSCCNCTDTQLSQYSIDSLTLSNLDNSGAFAVVSQKPIPRKAYGIKLQFNIRHFCKNNINKISIFSQAYAFSCQCPPDVKITPKDSITSFKISSIITFDEAHPSDSDVIDLFKVIDTDKFVTAAHVFAQSKTYFAKSYIDTQDIYLLTPPALPGVYSFKINVALSNGKQLSATTLPINLE